MAAGRVDAVITGADRIASNGDAANKIGTYGLAVLARPQHPVLHCRARLHVRPVAARRAAITIEERKAAEITHTAACSSRPTAWPCITPRSTSPRPALLVL